MQQKRDKEQRSIMDKELYRLVELVFIRSRRTLIVFPGIAGLVGWWSGQDASVYINPLMVSALASSYFVWAKIRGSFGTNSSSSKNSSSPSSSSSRLLAEQRQAATGAFVVMSSLIMYQSIFYQGCSACFVPAIFGFVPVATGFLFRSPQAIQYSTMAVIGMLVVIFTVDWSGHCPSEPLAVSASGGIIFVDRFLPLLMLICGNSFLVSVLIQHSQDSLELQAKATMEAAKLAHLRRDILHRVTHELRTPLNGLVGSVELLATSDNLAELGVENMENVLTMQRCLTSILGICDNVMTVATTNTKSSSSYRRKDRQKRRKERKMQHPDIRGPGRQQRRKSNNLFNLKPMMCAIQKHNNNTMDLSTSNDTHTTTSSMDMTFHDFCRLDDKDQEQNNCHEPPFVLASVVDDVTDLFADRVADKGVQLKVQFQGDTTTVVYGQIQTKLRQVLLNLVENSLKFTEQGSITLRVKTTSTPQSRRQLKDSSANDHHHEQRLLTCQFEVQDTGIGFDPAESELLFEPFHQGEQSEGGAVSRRHKGTGLGLAICRELVAQMGGEIMAFGEKGKGARFYFTLHLHTHTQEQQGGHGTSTNMCSSPTANGNTHVTNEPKIRSQAHVLIAAAETELQTSYQSIVQTLAPSGAHLKIVESVQELELFLDDFHGEDTGCSSKPCDVPTTTSAETQNVALVHCGSPGGSSESDFGSSTLARLRRCGWKVIVCGHRGSSACRELAPQSDDMVAVFGVPPPLVRVGDALQKALAEEAEPAVGSERRQKSTPGDNQSPPKPSPSSKTSASLFQDSGIMAAGIHVSPMTELTRERLVPSTAPSTAESSVTTLPFANKPVTTTPKPDTIVLGPRSKVVIVDDTPMNVKVLVRLMQRLTSAEIVSFGDGQSAVDFVKSSSPDDELLFLLGWHMPEVCGLAATKLIRQFGQDGEGPKVKICMLTADIEGLLIEVERSNIAYQGIVHKGHYTKREQFVAPNNCDEDSSGSNSSYDIEDASCDESPIMLDVVASKPATFQSIQAIFKGFQDKIV